MKLSRKRGIKKRGFKKRSKKKTGSERWICRNFL